MKKIILMLVLLFGLVGCGVICPSKPPKRAVMHNAGGMGMRYHFVMYEPVGDAGHTPSLKCTKYEYGRSHIYVDDLGLVDGDSIIWVASYQGQTSEMIPVDIKKSAHFRFERKEISITGLSGGYEYLNGIWRIETSSPSSWGIPITGD